MDPFGYNFAAGRSSAFAQPEVQGAVGNGWSPHRDELAELVRRLRARYSRRRLIRRTDVEEVVREMRWPEVNVPTVLRPTPETAVRPPRPPRRRIEPVPVVDMTMAEDVLE